MKYCPNRSCRYRRKAAQEFLDWAEVCNDCGMALVRYEDLELVSTQEAVEAWKAEHVAVTADPARIHIATGVGIIGLSIAGLFGSIAMADSVGKGAIVMTAIPLIAGFVRLVRSTRSEEPTPAAAVGGPYRSVSRRS